MLKLIPIQILENRDDITLAAQLVSCVESLNAVFSDVVAPKEAAIDSEGFRLLSAIGREQVEATHGSLIRFDTTSYAEKLVTYMGGRRGASGGGSGQGQASHLNWVQLGERALWVFNRPPTTNFL